MPGIKQARALPTETASASLRQNILHGGLPETARVFHTEVPQIEGALHDADAGMGA